MYDLLHWLSTHRAMEILVALGFVLVLIDYQFRTDVPAHFGYLCFAGAFFFALNLPPAIGLLAAVGMFVLLEVLHRFWFARFLTNAPGKERP